MTEIPIIFIDDEKYIRMAAKQTLELEGYKPFCFDCAEKALSHIHFDWQGVAVCDINLPGISGLEFMNQILCIDKDIPVILITKYGDIPTAIQAIRDGAYDFIEKPISNEILLDVIKRALEKRKLILDNRMLKKELKIPGPRIIGVSNSIKRLRKLIGRIAGKTDILLIGDTGTGKELIARSLHYHSKRKNKNYVALNCAAIPENLIEVELFGCKKGAHATAYEDRIGKFEYANGGTLFLDEIESMPYSLQGKILRVLEERKVEPLGSNKVIPIDLQVIAATKTDLKNEENFRQDLYYRLNVVTIEIPKLQERIEDVPLLFQHFMLIESERLQCDIPPLTQALQTALMSYKWPGNIRELRNVAKRYVLLGEEWDTDSELGSLITSVKTSKNMTLPEQVAQFEKSIIEQILIQYKGHRETTSTNLGIPSETLRDKMRKYNLKSRNYR